MRVVFPFPLRCQSVRSLALDAFRLTFVSCLDCGSSGNGSSPHNSDKIGPEMGGASEPVHDLYRALPMDRTPSRHSPLCEDQEPNFMGRGAYLDEGDKMPY
jgi:hypothetical protein